MCYVSTKKNASANKVSVKKDADHHRVVIMIIKCMHTFFYRHCITFTHKNIYSISLLLNAPV